MQFAAYYSPIARDHKRRIRYRPDADLILTTTGPRQADTIRRALAVKVDGTNPFQVVQSTWNVLEPSSAAALADAHAAGWGVLVMKTSVTGKPETAKRETRGSFTGGVSFSTGLRPRREP